MKTKTAKYFSMPLMKQTIRGSRALTIAIIIVMVLMCVVISVARNMMTTGTSADTTDLQTTFFTYLSILAKSGSEFNYDKFIAGFYDSAYGAIFANVEGYSLEELKTCVNALTEAGASIDSLVSQFEYNYALAISQGALTGNPLSLEGIMAIMVESMGISSDMLTNMSSMDMSSMLNQMYYTIMGLLPLLVYIVVVGNSLIANQVDRGSMAYVLSTPTKRSAVAITQAIYMIAAPFIMITITCCVKIAVSAALTGEPDAAVTIMLYFGMYILIEAMAALCYLGSCLFNRSGKSMAFGGGLTVWFFLASLLGLFGSDSLVQVGMGVEALGMFNNLTLIGLFDITAIGTIGTEAVDFAFVWKLIILFVIAVAAYVGGAIRFTKKDLPL